MDTPEGLKKPRRIAALIPLVVVIALVLSAVVFAVAHFAVKGPGPQRLDTPAQVATGQTPPERGPYNLSDFNEPAAK